MLTAGSCPSPGSKWGPNGDKMLTSFHVGDFKSYRKAALRLNRLTTLVGANASGKSNLIEAFRLFTRVAAGTRLETVREEVSRTDDRVRGQIEDMPRRGTSKFTLKCRTSKWAWNSYSMTLEIRSDHSLHIVDERLMGPGSGAPLFEIVAPADPMSTDVRVAYNNFARGGRKPQITCTDQIAVLEQLNSSARFAKGHRHAQKEIPATCRRYQEALSNVRFLDPQPSQMRQYSFRSDDQLASDGRNLSAVLYRLCNSGSGDTRTNPVLPFVRSLPEQDFTKINFIKTPRTEVMVKLTETFGGTPAEYDATQLSDGTLRVLAIAAAVLSAPKGGVIIVEEIDNGVHPSRVSALLESISRVAHERDLRVVISTHNPALLDGLPDNAIPNVVFCHRNPKDGTSRLIRLEEIQDYATLVARGPLGQLMTQGLVDRFAKDERTPEQRAARRLEWLRELRRSALQ